MVKNGGSNEFSELERSPKLLNKDEKWWAEKDMVKLNTTLILEAMASCTGITFVGERLIGDPLDVEMFKATGWLLDEPEQTESTDNVI